MEFPSPISISKPLALINDQNLKKDRPVCLFKLVFEIRFFDALLATEVIIILMERNAAHERFTYLLPVYRKKLVSCLEVWKEQGKVRENDCEEKMDTLYSGI